SSLIKRNSLSSISDFVNTLASRKPPIVHLREREERTRKERSGSAYVRPADDLPRRNNPRSRRIATNRNSATSAIGAIGAASARKDIRTAPPSSAVEMTKLPIPPVKTVECAL